MKTERESQEEFMAAAIAEAEVAAKNGEIPVGCVIVKDGKIIAEAHNTVEEEGSVLCHAEINAIDKAEKAVGKFLTDCEMYVTVEPCAMCAGAIAGARLKGLYYGAREERTGCCGSLYALTEDSRFFATVKTVGGIKEKECGELMREFFAKRRGQ